MASTAVWIHNVFLAPVQMVTATLATRLATTICALANSVGRIINAQVTLALTILVILVEIILGNSVIGKTVMERINAFQIIVLRESV